MEDKDDPVTICTSEAAAPKPTDLPLTDTRPTLACVPARRVHGLTPLQLAKKRANDRLAQQNARERRRALINSLELRVRDISSTWPHTDLRLVSEHNEVLKVENQKMLDSVKTIMDILLKSARKASESCGMPIDTTVKPFPMYGTRWRSVLQTTKSSNPGDRAHYTRESENHLQYDDNASDANPSPHGTSEHRHEDTPPGLASSSNYDCRQQDFKAICCRLLSSTSGPSRNFSSSMPLPRPGMAHSEAMFAMPLNHTAPTCDFDIIVLDFISNRRVGVVKHSFRKKRADSSCLQISSLLSPANESSFPSIAKVFEKILGSIPGANQRLPLPEQVAIFHVIFLLLRYQIHPTEENYNRLPSWLIPNQSQLLTPHPAWVDYLPWPSMRDRVVISSHFLSFDAWSILFTLALSVNWPYEATDCLLCLEDDHTTINPVFERHLMNLDNWTLGQEFAKAYPSLADAAKLRGSC